MARLIAARLDAVARSTTLASYRHRAPASQRFGPIDGFSNLGLGRGRSSFRWTYPSLIQRYGSWKGKQRSIL